MSGNDGIDLIAAERHRQIAEEGHTPDLDDERDDGQIAAVAAWLAAPNQMGIKGRVPKWGQKLSKKHADNRVLQLVIAGVLIARELDRLQRASGGGS